MDKSWQKNFLYFLGMVAALGGAWTFLKPAEVERIPSSISERHPDIENRLEMERKTIMALVIARTANAEGKLDDMKSTIQDFRTETREMLKKLDDRIYQLQREQAEQAAFRTRNTGDGS